MRDSIAVRKWLDIAASGVRFAPDRETVKAELMEHIEDKTADLIRIFPDMEEKDAQERALAAMGDPEELKISLAKVHRPWLGYLWQASRVLAAVLLVLTLFLCGMKTLENWKARYENQKNIQENGYHDFDYVNECYKSGIDPWRADGPYPKEDSVIRTPLAALRPEGSVRAGGYRFRMERAGLFHFRNGPGDPGYWRLFGEARALGLPWEPVQGAVLWRLRAVDSAGNQYASSHEVYNLHLDHEGYVMVNSNGSAGLEQSFDVEIIGITPGAEWIRLEYDHMGTQWSLTIPLEVEK